jgi:hypothetical protein
MRAEHYQVVDDHKDLSSSVKANRRQLINLKNLTKDQTPRMKQKIIEDHVSLIKASQGPIGSEDDRLNRKYDKDLDA